ncbi:MAG: V-type ATP synthase subunit F [Actinomycetota bacterium]|jgi:V/A-type H+-transporting ATPase subunit F|nr:V-type ATP synthase subunit F [Actinomycetota bacterium]
MKTKIAAIGENDIMLIFKAIGADVFPVSSYSQAAPKIKQAAQEGYGVIFITETMAAQLDDIIREYSDKFLPSIVVIPGLGKRNNYAIQRLRQAIIKAVGIDVMPEK